MNTQFIINAELINGGWLDIKNPIRHNFKIACKIAKSYAMLPNVKEAQVNTVRNNIVNDFPLRTFVNKKFLTN